MWGIGSTRRQAFWYSPRQLSHLPPLFHATLQPSRGGVNYLPENIEIHVGTKGKMRLVRTSKVTTYHWSNLLESEEQGNCFRMVIKSCHKVRGRDALELETGRASTV